MAIATAADGPARVIECSPITASGLAAASTAELGVHVSGWVQGTRDQVVLERTGMVLVGVHEVPEPSEPERDVHLTVLDVGWELGQVMATPSWLSEHLRAAPLVVLVTVATIPGLSRLEGALGLLGPGRAVVAVRVPRRKNGLKASSTAPARSRNTCCRATWSWRCRTTTTCGPADWTQRRCPLRCWTQRLTLSGCHIRKHHEGNAIMMLNQVLPGVALAVCPQAPGDAQKYADEITGYVLWGVIALFVLAGVVGIGAIVAGRVFNMPHASKVGVISIFVIIMAAVAYMIVPSIISGIIGSGCLD
ncbi:MAG: hypothetical protein WKF73_07505 [Nocardioidaceae bacterium]